MKIFLVGMPYSGKTTISLKVASILKQNYIDLDQQIEMLAGTSISHIFEQKGEAYFRGLERDVLQQMISLSENFVLACGGGTPCFFDNLDQMNAAGITIFLDVPVSVLYKRASQSILHDRPLLALKNDEDLLSTLENLYSQRLTTYQKATYTLSGSDINENDIINTINSGMTAAQ